MNPQPPATRTRAQGNIAPGQAIMSLPHALGSRVTNIVLNAQVQVAYACAVDARNRAQRAGACIEQSWPDTPVRRLVLDVYRAQAQSADVVAGAVLQGARRRCGLAFANL